MDPLFAFARKLSETRRLFKTRPGKPHLHGQYAVQFEARVDSCAAPSNVRISRAAPTSRTTARAISVTTKMDRLLCWLQAGA